MRIYKKQQTINGKTQVYRRYYLDFLDGRGIRRRLPAFEGKRQSEALGKRIETLIAETVSGCISPETENWLNGLPESMLHTLAGWQMIPEIRLDSTKRITQHLTDYIEILKSRGNCRDYIVRTESRCKRIIQHCKIKTFRDIRQSAIEKFLGYLKAQGYSQTSCNHHLDALNSFLSWAIEDNRLMKNPISKIRKKPRQSKRRGILTPEQFQTLVYHTIHYGITRGPQTGEDRGLLYYAAGCTGLRRNELLHLRWNDFFLSPEGSFIRIRAAVSKNKKTVDLPIPQALAALLAQRQSENRQERIFSMFGIHCRTSESIEKDLIAAGIPTADEDGDRIDFHSLRASYISFLLNRNVPLKTAQTLARHSDPRLTCNVYAKSLEESKTEAILALPIPQIVGPFIGPK